MSRGGLELVYVLAPPQGGNWVEPSAVERSRQVVVRRLEMLRVPAVVSVRGTSLLVGLPVGVGADQARRVKAILARPAQFELREVDGGQWLDSLSEPLPWTGLGVKAVKDEWSFAGGRREGRILHAPDETTADKAVSAVHADKLPAGVELLVERVAHPWPPEARARVYPVGPPRMTGDSIQDALVAKEGNGRPAVTVVFDNNGTKAFAELTRRLVGRKIAIVLDGRIMGAPIVLEAITGGRAIILLGGANDYATMKREAEDLAVALRGGALPSALTLEAERQIPPAR